MQTKYGRAKCTASPQTKTKIKHWQELLKQSNTTPPAQQFIFLKWNKTFCKAICPQEGPKAQVFILKNEPVLEINKCKRKALHTVLLKENLHLHNSKLLVSAKQMKFQAEPQVAVFLLCFFGWVTKKSQNDHVKWKCWLIQNRSFWCFCLSCLRVPMSPHLTKKLGDQCEFLLCSGMLAMLEGQQPVTGRQRGQTHRLSPLYVMLQIGVNFFMQLPSLFIPGATTIIDISRSACQAPGALLGSHPQMTSV